MVRPERDTHSEVWGILKDLRGLAPLKELFWSRLNYTRVNQALSRRRWGAGATEALAEDPVLFASGGADEAFHVIYARLASDKLLRTPERAVVSRLLQDHPHALFVFSNEAQDRWHFLNVKYDEKQDKRRLFRRITVGPEERLRTASERLAMLDLASVSPDLFGLAPLAIQSRHDDAFDVEAVTKIFFVGDPRTGQKGYKDIFDELQKDLERQTKDRHWAHDYALQFLNRLMFLYFVQRKRWLGDDTEFLRTFWEAYRAAGQPKDTFFDRWLKVLFFEAFNNRFHGGHRHFPDAIRDALAVAPYLNGGLFAANDLDRQHEFTVTDKQFQKVFAFLERYNFTITEDSPLDQEVAVDPEMIGKVYESLVNVSEEADERGEAGIFYTPRTEIDLMCRLALVDNLANHLGAEHKNLFYEAVFALVPDEKEAADAALAKAGLWPAVQEHLKGITVADLACGSGSFLVGMLHVLDDLQERAGRCLGREESAYDRRRRIIGRSLYGVDVMEWACHVAELRLWLALIIDVEMQAAELHCPKDNRPLLPNFSFKVRCGDSLVQEVGGIQFSHRRANLDLFDSQKQRAYKRRLANLRKAKLAFFSGEPDPKFKTEAAIRGEEVAVFKDLLAEQVKSLDEQAKKLMRQQAVEEHAQMRLDGTRETRSKQLKLAREERERKIERLMEEKARLEAARQAMRKPGDVPFVWDIAFAEVMESDAKGFDIVVGNPPYVRQESIADPRLPREKVTTTNKKAYKAKLARSVYQAWPRFFRYKPSSDTPGRKLNAKSDLYVYFYFHGLALLAEKGSFCFITSNSWLDVGYGADLQEFLLRRGHVRMVIDNQAKRSFKEADVNTVIVLLASPDDGREEGPERIARFVLFKVPFEQVLSPVVFEEVEAASNRKVTPEYRAFPIRQDRLLQDGCEIPDEGEEDETDGKKAGTRVLGPLPEVTRYVGNKWGGKYLRAPDIYWTILEKGKGKLVRLGDIAEVRRGFTTGANEFFYVDGATRDKFRIEPQFLVPVVKTPRECRGIVIDPADLGLSVFVCDKSREELRGSGALDYIRWGESQKFHLRPTCAPRQKWYELACETGEFLWWKSIGERYCFFWNPHRVAVDQRNYYLNLKAKNIVARDFVLSLNATVDRLLIEATAREMTGAYTIIELPVCDVIRKQFIYSVFPTTPDVDAILSRPIGNIDEEVTQRDRQALDTVVFDEIGLTSDERDAVYEAVLNLVEARLKKSESV